MKKFIRSISILLCLALSVFALAACSAPGAPDHSVKDPNYAISTERLETELAAFLNGRKDRTSFSQAEHAAALYLQERLIEFGYGDAKLQDFFATENDVTKLNSQNVVACYNAVDRDADTKNVILGAYYDNRYSKAYNNAKEYKSEGALANGTGVAALLAIAEYLKEVKPALEYDVTIVFFGGSFLTDVGAQAFYKDGMTHAERKNTVLMVELQRIGCDHVYAFSDARETKRETFFDKIAAANKLDVYKPTQKAPLITNGTVYEGIPYFQWAHSGVFGAFFKAGIPTLNLIGANWETVNMTDRESSEYDNMSYTDKDDLATLKRRYPDYSKKMATAATLVIRSLESAEFLSVMKYDRANFPNTDVLTKSWIWYLVVLGFIALCAGALTLVCSKLTKKYPIERVQPKRVKMAVFGMEYEDADSSDIFIDVKDAPTVDDIFPGIPNNDERGPRDPFDDIFPDALGASVITNNVAPVDSADATADSGDKSLGDTPDPESQRSAGESNADVSDKSVPHAENPEERHVTAATENKSESSASQTKPAAKRSGSRATTSTGTAKKRNTVSAGKSVRAKRSTNAGEKDADGDATERNGDGD